VFLLIDPLEVFGAVDRGAQIPFLSRYMPAISSL
jgi:hypothetical protein